MIRVLTTIALAILVLAGIWYLPLKIFQALILFVIGIGLWEYASLVFEEKNRRIFLLILGLGFGAVMTWFPSKELILFSLIGVLFLSFLWELKFHEPLQESIHRVGLSVLGVCYLSLTLPFWSYLKALGKEWVMLLLFPSCLTDTFGFLVGKTLGRKKIAPVVSPNKTWEGFFSSLFGGIFGLWLASKLFFRSEFHSHYSIWWDISWKFVVPVGIGISLAAILGDLMESLIKRSAKVKDSSHLIPGHGGILDRLDALIFTAPLFYFLLWVSGSL